jgi:hypothetical protein
VSLWALAGWAATRVRATALVIKAARKGDLGRASG